MVKSDHYKVTVTIHLSNGWRTRISHALISIIYYIRYNEAVAPAMGQTV